MVIGAFAALASYALFHLVTVFPLSWITLYSRAVDHASSCECEMIGAVLGAAGDRGLRPARRPHRPPPHAGRAGHR